MLKDKISRREFVQLTGSILIASMTGATLSALFNSCTKEKSNPVQPPQGISFTIKLSEHPELSQVGGFKTFTVNSRTNDLQGAIACLHTSRLQN
jgi:hypothetical protein